MLAACTDVESTFLEGQWRSNKELTIENLKDNVKLSNQKKEFLHRELGKLTIVFKGNRSAIYFADDHEKLDDLEWGKFSITNSNDKTFTLLITNSQINNKEFVYTWAGDCFYLNSIEWGFHEYFCKMPLNH